MASERVPSPSGRDILSADLIGERSFAVVRRGFDRDEVQDFLKQVAGAVRTLHERMEQAAEDRREAEQRARHPEINEDVLMERVGEETASILRSARAAAGDMRTRAAEEATRIIDEAHQRAGDIRAEAETAMARSVEEANRSAEELRSAAQTAGDQLVDRARQEVESLRQMAEQERKLTVEGAQSIREKILADLGRRRRVATVQIEQLRAGRERLLESYGVVRRTLEEVQDELQRADAEARGAAEEVGRDWDEADSLDVLPDLLGAPAASEAAVEGSPVDEPAVSPEEERVEGSVPEEPVAEADSIASEAVGPESDGSEANGSEANGSEAVGPEVPGSEANGSEANGSEAVGPEVPGSEVVAAETETAAAVPASVAVDQATDIAAPGESATGGEVETPTPRAQPVRRTGTGRRKTGTGRPPVRPPVRRREVPVDGPAPAVSERPSSALTSGVEEAQDAAASAEAAASAHVVTAPEPGLAAGDAVEGRPGEDGNPESPSVEGLFARIRAGREEAVTQARQVLSGDAVSSGTSDDTASGDTASGDTASGDTAVIAPPDHTSTRADEFPPVTAAGADKQATGPDSDDDTDSGLVRSSEDESLLERREAALGEVEMILTRKLKRALQDEQNSLLDRLRSARGEPDPATLLDPVDEHRQRYVDAALPQLELAARAGSRFALEVVKDGGRKGGAQKRPAKVDDLAADLASTLSGQIRRRVEQALQSAIGASGRGDDQSAMTEALGAAYRETKTQRVERAAGDQVTAAFSRGIWEAAGDRVPLRWVVEDIDGPCPDCDDNALAGALPRHEGFPTGQAHPPAHSGCRCLVVPDLR